MTKRKEGGAKAPPSEESELADKIHEWFSEWAAGRTRKPTLPDRRGCRNIARNFIATRRGIESLSFPAEMPRAESDAIGHESVAITEANTLKQTLDRYIKAGLALPPETQRNGLPAAIDLRDALAHFARQFRGARSADGGAYETARQNLRRVATENYSAAVIHAFHAAGGRKNISAKSDKGAVPFIVAKLVNRQFGKNLTSATIARSKRRQSGNK